MANNYFIIIVLLCILVSKSYGDCSSNYYKDSNGVCQPCDISCQECSGPGYSACKTCSQGFALVNNTNCTFECDEQIQFLDFNTQLCRDCPYDSGCTESGFISSICRRNEYLLFNLYSPIENKCVLSCPEIGFYSSTKHNRCIPCRDPNCQACDSQGKCTQCNEWWHLDRTSGRCLWQCGVGCRSCSSSSPSNCLACETGWTLSSGTCTSSVPNCWQYTGSECSKCVSGYYLFVGLCYKGPANCLLPLDLKNCLICNRGYFWGSAGCT